MTVTKTQKDNRPLGVLREMSSMKKRFTRFIINGFATLNYLKEI